MNYLCPLNFNGNFEIKSRFEEKTGSKGDVYLNTLHSQQCQEYFLSVENGLF